ncbi:MAG: hypothetical protein WCK52_03375 [Betaproteobacteria bacterium]
MNYKEHFFISACIFRKITLYLVSVFLLASSSFAYADLSGVYDGYLQKRASAFLMIMGYSLTPDVTTGSLSMFDSASNTNPDLQMTSFGGGAVISDDFPLYLEGTLALNRYDPTFVASSGSSTNSPLPVKWNSISGTGGIGWDFPIAQHLRFRPMFNFTLGHVESDLSLAARYIDYKAGIDLDFLKNGRLNVYGLGGSLMLVYEDRLPEREIDIELRYTNIQLNSFDSSVAVSGHSSSESLGLWARRRVPTSYTIFDKTIRNVYEFAHTEYLGDMRGALGFNNLSSLGTGLEIDTTDSGIFFTRLRALLRYQFGANVRGWSVGFAASF